MVFFLILPSTMSVLWGASASYSTHGAGLNHYEFLLGADIGW